MSSILNITLPFFALIGIGYLAARRGIFNQDGARALTTFVFYFALPCLLFRVMATRPIHEIFDSRFMAAYFLGSMAAFVVAALIGRILFRGRLGVMGVHGIAGSNSNIGFLGLPLIIELMGPEAGVPVGLGLLVDLIILIPLGIGFLEAAKGGGNGAGQVVRDVCRGMIVNPFTLSMGAGVLFSALELSLPTAGDIFTRFLGSAAGPGALFALGATLAGRPISDGLAEAAYMTVTKLFLHPVLMWVAMVVLFDVTPMWAQAAVFASALPIAANLYVIAQKYDTHPVRSSTAILISTAVAVVSFSALVGFYGL